MVDADALFSPLGPSHIQIPQDDLEQTRERWEHADDMAGEEDPLELRDAARAHIYALTAASDGYLQVARHLARELFEIGWGEGHAAEAAPYARLVYDRECRGKPWNDLGDAPEASTHG